MYNEAMNIGAELRKEEIHRGSNRYIRLVSTPVWSTLMSTKTICKSSRRHFETHFTKEPGVSGDEFCNNLADFPWLEPTEETSCKCEITEGVQLALKRVVSGKSLELVSGCIVIKWKWWLGLSASE